jgi:hypothetical protein
MKQVLSFLEQRVKSFSELTYFKLLERSGIRSDVDIMARGLSFFVLSFQDALRLNASTITDPTLLGIAKQQRRDDAGHDLWFLNDLGRLGVEPNVRWLFSKKHEATRDTAYAIIARVLSAKSDHARLAVGLALEATGGVYFSRVHAFFTRLGLSEGMQFFAKSHWDAEQSHDVFGDEIERALNAITLDESERADALAAAEATFAAVTRMCEQLSSEMLAARLKVGFVSEEQLVGN